MSVVNLFARKRNIRSALSAICARRYFYNKSNIVASPVADVDIPNVLLHQYLWSGFDKWHDKIAVECVETKKKLTYEEIRKKSRSFAGFLQKYGLGKGDTIAIILPNVPEFFVVLLGSIEAGVTITTVNPDYTSDEIKKQLIHSNAKIAITLSSLFPRVRKACDEIVNVSKVSIITINHTENELSHERSIKFCEVSESNYPFREPNIMPEDVVLLPYSSGTTGLPKGVQLTHRNLISNYVVSSVPEFKLNNDTTADNQDVIPIIVPMYHLYGLGVTAITMFARGAKCVTGSKFTTDMFYQILHNYKASLIYVVPPMVLMLLNMPELKLQELPALRTVVSAAAPLGAADINRFHDKTRGEINLLQMYGMTECAPLTHHQSFMLDHGVKIGGSGFALPNTLCKIIDVNDPDCRGLAPNESGELLCKGPQIMKGYLNNEEANKQIFTHDGYLKTGDIAHYDENGHFFITDRLKELIKVSGYQVAPAELEELLRDHPDISDAAVIAKADERRGEVPKAFVVIKKDSNMTAKEVQEYIATKVVKYKRLTGGVTIVDSIPKTASGKILRRELKNL